MKTETQATPPTEFESGHPLARPSPFRYMPIVILVLLLLNLFSSCNSSRRLNLAIQNKPYIYVQTTDRDVLKAKPVDPLHREEGVIADFALDWLELAFTWRATPGAEKNYVNEGGVNYPVPFHFASLALKPGYREAFMEATTKKYRQDFLFSKYISGEYQSYLRSFEKPVVESVRTDNGDVVPGFWDVKIAAIRTHAAGDETIAHEIFNRVIRLKAIEPSNGNKNKNPSEDKACGTQRDLGELLAHMQDKGLQVVSVTEI